MAKGIMNLESVMISQAKFLEHDKESHDKFQNVLRRLRSRIISSSMAAVSVFRFLDHNSYSDVLAALKPFLPENYSPVGNDPDSRECASFLKKLGRRYSGENVAYTKFLGFMNAYSRTELTHSQVCENVHQLFYYDQELAVEFSSFLPELKRRTLNHKKDRDQEIVVAAEAPPPPPPRMLTKEQEKDFEMEDMLCNHEVQIGQLESTYKIAEGILQSCLNDIGHLSAVYGPAGEYFPALNLSCVKKIYKQVLENDMIQCEKLPELMHRLMKKKEILEKSRDKIKEKWIKIRQSRSGMN